MSIYDELNKDSGDDLEPFTKQQMKEMDEDGLINRLEDLKIAANDLKQKVRDGLFGPKEKDNLDGLSKENLKGVINEEGYKNHGKLDPSLERYNDTATNLNPLTIKFKRIRDVKKPERGTPLSAGLDFFIPKNLGSLGLPKDNLVNNKRNAQGEFILEIRIRPFGDVLIPSGIKTQLPNNTVLIAFDKSGVCTKLGLIVGAKVVDEDYQGEVHIHLRNLTDKEVILQSGQKIVQFLLLPSFYVDLIEDDNIHQQITERGEGGFGHTDNK